MEKPSSANKVVIFMNKKPISVPIPHIVLPDTGGVKIVPVDEPLVCISDTMRELLLFQPRYFDRGVPGAIRRVYVRKTVAEMLLAAARALPEGYKLMIFDAWRPFAVQKALFDEYYLRLAHKASGKSEEELLQLATQFVSYPTGDPSRPYVHATGGAVDLTIADETGAPLNMGTDFDDFSDAAHTAWFEKTGSREIRDNRRLLYHTMVSAGFTNYPCEWWHYDFGDRFWAAATNRDSVYSGIYTEPR
ncbi:MAG: M15 family metallopeptidase [Oscillospiraceae bacterium]|nr:M15 family metallopeptidase [Oscillospiraceae bacterium]